MMWVFFMAVLFGNGDAVHIRVVNNASQPVSGVRVALVLYDFRGTTAYEVHVGSCVTDAAGACRIVLPRRAPKDPGGMYRGALVVGDYGRRSVLWPGGELQIVVNVDRMDEGRESAPLSGDEGWGLQIRPGWQRYLGWLGFALALGLLIITLWGRQR